MNEQTLSSKFLNFIYMKFLGREHERGAFYKKLLSRIIILYYIIISNKSLKLVRGVL